MYLWHSVCECMWNLGKPIFDIYQACVPQQQRHLPYSKTRLLLEKPSLVGKMSSGSLMICTSGLYNGSAKSTDLWSKQILYLGFAPQQNMTWLRWFIDLPVGVSDQLGKNYMYSEFVKFRWKQSLVSKNRYLIWKAIRHRIHLKL